VPKRGRNVSDPRRPPQAARGYAPIPGCEDGRSCLHVFGFLEGRGATDCQSTKSAYARLTSIFYNCWLRLNTGTRSVKADCDRMRSFAHRPANTVSAGTAEPQFAARAAAPMPAAAVQSLSRHDIRDVPVVAAESPQASGAPGYSARGAIHRRRNAGPADPDYGPALQAYARPGSRLAGRDEAAPAPSMPGRTGLPTALKAGVEALSGFSMDTVRVHYNSPEPARINAHAYARGNDIHLAPGRQTHLAHEAWHVVQQAQKRVTPTMRMAGRTINHDRRLEAEADRMGSKLLSAGPPAREAPAPALRAPPSLDGSPVQPVFRSDTGEEIKPDKIVETLNNRGFQPQGQLPLNKLVKKLAEGPDIKVDLEKPETVVAGVNARLSGPAGRLMTAAKTEGGSAARKINRILGNMQNRLKTLPNGDVRKISAGYVEEISKQLQQALFSNTQQIQAIPVKGFADLSSAYLEAFLKVSASRNDRESVVHAWLGFEIVNQLGPLLHSVRELLLKTNDAEGASYLEKIQERNLLLLKQIRFDLAKRVTIAVVAHRGTGPTNKTMRGLISQQDDRRKYRLPENSPAAFGFALDTARTSLEKGLPGLDGIECDVYLSSDGVPIVSHEDNAFEQLNQEQQDLWPHQDRRDVKDLSADELRAIKRTAAEGSQFITLAELLELAYPVAGKYFEVTGRPFRIEVEMKGTKAESIAVDAAPELRQASPSQVTGALTQATAKVISRMVKSHQGLPVEYVLFNGTATDIPKFAALRQTKTALGGLYTGLGFSSVANKFRSGPKKGKMGIIPMTHLDEVRYGFNIDQQISGQAPLQFSLWNAQNYIVTLVFAQEFAPLELVELEVQMDLGHRRITEPSHDIDMQGNTDVSSDRQKREAKDKTSSDEYRDSLIDALREGQPAALLHILTDYPDVAEWIKKKIDTRNNNNNTNASYINNNSNVSNYNNNASYNNINISNSNNNNNNYIGNINSNSNIINNNNAYIANNNSTSSTSSIINLQQLQQLEQKQQGSPEKKKSNAKQQTGKK
jgi:glycerophosphoryl diester phosphodiesterase